MALTANAELLRKDGEIIKHKMAAVKVYQGALVKQNAAGFLANCVAEKGAVFAGVSVEKCDNSAGSAGDLSCRVYKKGIFLLTGSGFAQTDVGQNVYATDENTVTKTNAADAQRVGTISEFESSTQVWVKIDDAVHNVGLEATIADLSASSGSYVQAESSAQATAINAILAILRKNKMISES